MTKKFDESIYAFTIGYLPILKSKFTNLLGSTNEIEQFFIDSAFESYHLYLFFAQNEDDFDEELTSKLIDLRKNIELKIYHLMPYHASMLLKVQQSDLIELEVKLLTDILESYREFVQLINLNQSMN